MLAVWDAPEKQLIRPAVALQAGVVRRKIEVRDVARVPLAVADSFEVFRSIIQIDEVVVRSDRQVLSIGGELEVRNPLFPEDQKRNERNDCGRDITT